MANIVFDAVADNTAELDARGYLKKTAKITISDLPDSCLGRDDLIVRANSALKSAGFATGAAHPVISDLVLNASKQFTVLSRRVVEVLVTYTRAVDFDAQGKCLVGISGGCSISNEQTNLDKDGKEIYTEWRPDIMSDPRKQPAQVDCNIPISTKTYNLIYNQDPGEIAADNVGKVAPDRKTLCSGFSYSLDKANGWWEVSIEFSFHPVGWDKRIFYTLENGLPPTNYNEPYNRGKTVKTVKVLKEGSFSGLGLPGL